MERKSQRGGTGADFCFDQQYGYGLAQNEQWQALLLRHSTALYFLPLEISINIFAVFKGSASMVAATFQTF